MSVASVLGDLRAAAEAAGREPGSVRLVAVTKGHSAADVQRCVLAHGDFPLGESRGQELRDKRAELEQQVGRALVWHYIGPLQTNKLKYLRGVQLVHTLERADHAAELARLGEKWSGVPDVLIQVHNGEAQKHGVQPEHVRALYHQVSQMGIRVRGLMVMAPLGDLTAAERVFTDTARLAHDLGLSELSMGMSDDYEVAVRCGATLVRIGRALFT